MNNDFYCLSFLVLSGLASVSPDYGNCFFSSFTLNLQNEENQ